MSTLLKNKPHPSLYLLNVVFSKCFLLSFDNNITNTQLIPNLFKRFAAHFMNKKKCCQQIIPKNMFFLKKKFLRIFKFFWRKLRFYYWLNWSLLETNQPQVGSLDNRGKHNNKLKFMHFVITMSLEVHIKLYKRKNIYVIKFIKNFY